MGRLEGPGLEGGIWLDLPFILAIFPIRAAMSIFNVVYRFFTIESLLLLFDVAKNFIFELMGWIIFAVRWIIYITWFMASSRFGKFIWFFARIPLVVLLCGPITLWIFFRFSN